jgi:hypothetical protein
MLNRDPLPFATVEWLFGRLAVRYGRLWIGRWDGLDAAVVKEDWRYELAGITTEQLTYALEHLPHGRTPDVGEFRKLCLEMPAPDRFRLEPPKPKAGVPAQIREAVARALQPPPPADEPRRIVEVRRNLATLETLPSLTPFQRGMRTHYRRVIERWENRKAHDAERLAQAKAEAQAQTEAALVGQGQGDAA